MRLTDQVAIVTGAGSGMGRAISIRLASEGATVAVSDINLRAAEETVSLIKQENKNAFALEADVSQSEMVRTMVEEVWQRTGRLDIVINNAGMPQAFTPIEELEESHWDKMMDVNAKSVFLTSKYAVPYMKKQQRGAIVNISSIASERARPGLNAYCASKGAVAVLTKALAIELASFGIRVNAINPGPANTDMLGKFIGDQQEIESQKKEVFLASIPLGTLIEPDDIANGVLYLCSDLAAKVTGTILNIDGGRGI